MEYWANPIKTFTNTVLPYPKDTDPIVASLHNGEHCLFYDPGVHKARIQPGHSLQDICNWANIRLSQDTLAEFFDEPLNWYDIANIVKLNIWVKDIREQGIVKPMLLNYTGNEKFGINNGESRLRAVECIPEIATVESFITTHTKYADKFKNLPQIENFEQFAEICRADVGQEFLFKYTDKLAPYGIEWYEYNNQKTAGVTPGTQTTRKTLHNYLKQYPDTVFQVDWFNNAVDWTPFWEPHNGNLWE